MDTIVSHPTPAAPSLDVSGRKVVVAGGKAGLELGIAQASSN